MRIATWNVNSLNARLPRVVELFEAQDDEPEQIRPPAVRKQSDETNLAWAARFRRERDLPPAALIDGSP